MLSTKYLILAAALLSSTAVAKPAESSTAAGATPSIGPCLLGCFGQAKQCVITDTACMCSNTEFQQAVAACVTQQCPDQLSSATALQASQCGSTSGSASGSASAAAASSTSKSNGAAKSSSQALVGPAAALLSVVAGGLFLA
ncbi:hypothetical protein DL96DRAFT_692497 [Flagelloscypha sp. PMI_526]|nr:hypothetical protein DL96DRAFT_692497 [Flagelloscypha sp. PMI_526]